VLGVWTGGDLAALAGPLTVSGPKGFVPLAHPTLAVGRVLHVGQAIVALAAEDRQTARDALDLLGVDYAPLPAVAALNAALAADSPQLHDVAPGNVVFTWNHRAGDPDAAFAEADVVVTLPLRNQRVAGVPIEPRGVIARPDGRGGLLVHTATQNPHGIRQHLARVLDLPEESIRVIAPDVGGAFGVKGGLYAEEAIVAALALHLDRPVKWIDTRGDFFVATHHGRAQEAEIALAARWDGVITGLRARLQADLEASPRGAGVALNTAQLLSGVYRFQHVDVTIRGIYSNTMGTGAYRGAGRPEAVYYVERAVDALASELGLDPADLRRRNFIAPDEFPYTTPTGATYDSGDYAMVLGRALELADYDRLRAEQERLRRGAAGGSPRYLGIGVATFTEVCAYGATESAHVRVEPDGSVIAATGMAPGGQGYETTFAQLVADELTVPFERIRIIHGDTTRVPVSSGTGGVRGTVIGGSAVMRAAAQVRERAIQVASYALEAAPDDVMLDNTSGLFAVRGAPDHAMTLAEIATFAVTTPVGALPEELRGELAVTAFFSPPGATAPFGADVAVVEVDPETGAIDLLRYIAVDDCGRAISPLQVDGQIHGGLVQGIGQALWEAVVYDDEGQLVTGSLMDYAVPRAAALPMFETERTETISPLNPLGAKGAGELGTIGAAPTIVNAVVDALSPFGVTHLDMPLWPERVWQAIQAGRMTL
jgi:aerobic carbon-monoxide dehydrogenase large subunit